MLFRSAKFDLCVLDIEETEIELRDMDDEDDDLITVDALKIGRASCRERV